jgi:hypothetical protein
MRGILERSIWSPFSLWDSLISITPFRHVPNLLHHPLGVSFFVSVCELLSPTTMYPALSSISNGVIHPGLSSGCDPGLESLTAIACSPCADAPGGLAILACVILSRWYCCNLRFSSLVCLSCAGLFSADDISMCDGDVEGRSVSDGAMTV